jgi:hypothetical protein
LKTEAEKDVRRWINQAAYRLSGKSRSGERAFEEMRAVLIDRLKAGWLDPMRLDEVTRTDLNLPPLT